MGNDFLPRGHLYFSGACQLAAEIHFKDKWVGRFSNDEMNQLTVLGDRHRAGAGRNALATPLATEAVALIARFEQRKTQIEKVAEELRQHLYAEELESWLQCGDGHLWPIPARIWGTDEFDQICRTDEITMEVGLHYWEMNQTGAVLLRESDIERVFGALPRTAASNQCDLLEPSVDLNLPRRGARAKFNWDALWIEICGSIYDDGVPETHAELIARIQAWCQSNFGTSPDDSTLKPKIRKLFERLRKGGN